MKNRDIQATWKYHNGNKHSYWSIRNHPHLLDWANRPLPFKIYPKIEPFPLPRDVPQTGVAVLSAISEILPSSRADSVPGVEDLARLLYFSAGITKQRAYPEGEVYFRAAACTGALYEIELYLVSGDLPGLDAGVYHFNPADVALRLLREGDFRGNLVQATAMESAVAHAPATIICTGTYWRNAWKYQARTYRHFGWDNGTLLANLLAVATALGMPAKVICGYVDAEVNRLLDVDPEREVAYSLVALGRVEALAQQPPSKLSALHLETVPLSRNETVYPAMREIHAASSLNSPEEVEIWRDHALLAKHPSPTGPILQLHPYSDAEMPRDPIEQVILRRGSARKFAQVPIDLPQLSTILDRATRGIPADFLNPQGAQLNEVYLIVNAVEGLDPGAYVYHRDHRVLERLKAGNFRAQAGHLGLDQQLPVEAAADIFFLADLQIILGRFGNRGYRAVQLEAGILSGKLYLAAYAQRLSATGLTFYDDEVIQFFSPRAQDKSVIMLVAVGKNAKSMLQG